MKHHETLPLIITLLSLVNSLAQPETPFTKIANGPVATDVAASWGAAWGDFDNDGFIDLVVSNEGADSLYRNNRDGTFTKIISSPVVENDGDLGSSLAWADYDNDGNPDLFVGGYGSKNKLFRNNGNGALTKTAGNVVVAEGDANGSSWGDYNGDGWIDLLTASSENPHIRLFRNNRDGNFSKTTSAEVGPMLGETERAIQGIWGDYDNDGDLDLLMVFYVTGRISLYRNNGGGVFERLAKAEVGDLDGRLAGSSGVAWGDYDNDGHADLFATQGNDHFNNGLTSDVLFRNNGNGMLTKMTAELVGPLVDERQPGRGCAWADYDNDGFLDLFVTNPGLTSHAGEKGRNNLLYHNEGNGHFTQVTAGNAVNDIAASTGGIWGDFDNDGFMDLFVANGEIAGPQANALYRNNANSNAWLKLRLVGNVSNRSAIGAKVRVKATIKGRSFWQMREISGGDGHWSQNDLRPNFGLGDAVVAETVRIEWPSGIVQEFHHVAAKQILTLTEPGRLEPRVIQANGLVELKVRSWKGFIYDIEASSDLKSWARLTTLTNETGTLSFADPVPGTLATRFYRLLNR